MRNRGIWFVSSSPASRAQKRKKTAPELDAALVADATLILPARSEDLQELREVGEVERLNQVKTIKVSVW